MSSREWSSLSPSIRSTIELHHQILPIKMSSLARALNVPVIASTLPAGISGEIRPNGSGYTVKVNRHDSSKRQRFTVAHELSHFLLHKDQIRQGISDDALYRSSLSDAREAEANRLAADILMPSALVQRERLALGNMPQDDVVAALASRFDVSEAAMRIRLGLS